MNSKNYDYFIEVFYHTKKTTEMTGFIGHKNGKGFFIPIIEVDDWDYVQSKVKR